MMRKDAQSPIRIAMAQAFTPVSQIDNGFIVAWTANMNYEVGKAAISYSASLFSGEGFVTRFTDKFTVQRDLHHSMLAA